jgi:hypothetical protein
MRSTSGSFPFRANEATRRRKVTGKLSSTDKGKVSKMVSAAQTCLDDAKRLLSAPTPEEKGAAQRALDPPMTEFKAEKYHFDQLVAGGIKQAGEWERQRR